MKNLLFAVPVFFLSYSFALAAPTVTFDISDPTMLIATTDPGMNPDGFDGLSSTTSEMLQLLDVDNRLVGIITTNSHDGGYYIPATGYAGMIQSPYHFRYISNYEDETGEDIEGTFYGVCIVADPIMGWQWFGWSYTEVDNSDCRNWTPPDPGE